MTIDFHTHILPPTIRNRRKALLTQDRTFAELFSNSRSSIATADELINEMDKENVDMSVVMGIGWTDLGIAIEANNYIVEAVKNYPTRLVGFSGINPAWGDSAAYEAERCANLGLRGIGELHPTTQEYNLGDSATMQSLVSVINEHGLILATHCSEPVGHSYSGKGNVTLNDLWCFITKFPEVPLVCAHWGGGLPFYSLMPEVAKALENVYFDTAASCLLYDSRIFSSIVNIIGADKVLLGSDYPLVNPGRILNQLRSAGLTIEQQKAISHNNARRLLDRRLLSHHALS